jgi:Domain of unknown function (DUF4349)
MGSTGRRLVVVLAAAAVALGACSGGSADSASTAGAAPNGARAPEAAGGAPDLRQAKAPDLRADQRSIVYTGAITVRVDDVDQKAAQATAIAAGAGGFVGKDDRSSGSGPPTASLQLRVPAEKFFAVVEQLAALGRPEQRSVSTEDVTDQTLDLDARIAVQQARVDSGRHLLAQAKSLSDLVMLEREVATREADLASLQAKKRHLADLTTLSTITVVLLAPAAVAARHDNGPPGFLAGLAGGWRALVASLAVLLTVLGALLPWLAALGVPALAVLWAARRYRRRGGAGDPALAAAAPGGTDGSEAPD